MNCIATKINGKFKIIKYAQHELEDIEAFLIKGMKYIWKKNEWNYETKNYFNGYFWILVLTEHEIKADEVDVILRDQRKMYIDLNDLALLMNQFRGCSHFFIELVVKHLDDAFPLQLKEVCSSLRQIFI